MSQSANGYSYWRPDSTTPDCELCLMQFTMFNRRHHCRDCGGIFCAKCTETKVMMPHRKHQKPERICTLCHKYVVNKLLKKSAIREHDEALDGEQPLFVGSTYAGAGLSRGFSMVEDEEVKNQYERIARKFRDAMIKRTEMERDVSNYSFVGGGHRAGSMPPTAGGGDLQKEFSNNMSFSGQRQHGGAGGGGTIGALLDHPKKDKYVAQMTKSDSCARRPGIGSSVTGDVMSLLNLKSNGGGPPPTPGPGNATFAGASSPKAQSVMPTNHGTRNNVHPSFLRVREALNNAHKMTLDSGARSPGRESHASGGHHNSLHASPSGNGEGYHPKPSIVSVF